MDTQVNNQEVADRFGSVARRFCNVVDSAPSLSRVDLLTQLYGILPQLISEAISLPDLELRDAENEDEDKRNRAIWSGARLKESQWGELYTLLKEKLGDWDLYWQVFDPTRDKEAIGASLADDIADVYRDLKGGVILNENRQSPPEDIIWHWRLLFYSHWGKHAMDALRTTHFLLEEILSL